MMPPDDAACYLLVVVRFFAHSVLKDKVRRE